MIERDHVSAGTAARKAGYSRRHVLRLIASGNLDGVDVSRSDAKRARWSVRRESLERLLERRAAAQKLGHTACGAAQPAEDSHP